MGIALPRITRVRLFGFNRFFVTNDLVLDVSRPLYVLLGGNGLGKTTILQAMIYGLAGGLDSDRLEPDKALRWNHNYFRGRIPDRIGEAFVDVEFELADAVFSVRRGFVKNSATRFTLTHDGGTHDWNASSANEAYEQAVCTYGHYTEFDDFRFLVHRLLYLAEDRRNITWDPDAQLRILMLLSPQHINEYEFRKKRAVVKRFDSDRRHANVRIGHIRAELESRGLKNQQQLPDQVSVGVHDKQDSLRAINLRLEELLKSRLGLLDRLGSMEIEEKRLRQLIDELGEDQKKAEAQSILSSLVNIEETSNLFLNKLLNAGTCPACGQVARELQKLARQRAANHSCVICGVNSGPSYQNSNYEDVDSILSEKLRAKNSLDLEISDVRYQLDQISREESALRTEYELIRMEANTSLNPPSKVLNSKNLGGVPDELLLEELKRNQEEAERLSEAVRTGTEDLELDYKRFLRDTEVTHQRLVEVFEVLAGQFLGTSVTLIPVINRNDAFINYQFLVPEFDGIVRETADHCSEAQRFFLDIAMRMALLQIAAEMSGFKSSFICETPESALDVSYVEFAAKMFRQFVEDGHSLVISTNLQRLGLAQRLLLECGSAKIDFGALDMLSVSNLLTDIQRNSDELRDIRDEILGTAGS